MLNIKHLYIFFSTLALIIFFFSTEVVKAKSFEINDIEITQPFEINFDKNKVIDLGFKKAFFEIVYSLIKSQDFEKIDNIRLNEIKSMIETFSIKEEKFINQKYYVNLGVSFDKKKIFRYLEKKNIFPSRILKEQFLFIPVIINEKGNDISIFSNNPIYADWNKTNKRYQLIEYLLPSEDLEDLNLIKEKLDVIETYDFNEITKKYFLKNSIISLIFKDKNEIRILTKIYNDKNEIIKNDTFKNINIDNKTDLNFLIENLKNLFDDTWKKLNEINTSIKVPIKIKIKNDELKKSNNFELFLNEIDMVSDYSVEKFDKEFIFYEVLFNGTVQNFIKIMKNKKYNLNTQKKVWMIE
ncbi:hypothetical protein [Candidatus Pelagibacter sp. RS39]|uniref:hypothetical protein n=1 Tax=Candidatus Pelagibacter sp. RS39 TaxID=1977864 RepID=UPI000A14962A|nr:hypothetical protein [Candidatus Pelagibacter sp. RS39]ARJ48127.1 hypothetical protein B5L73_04900 [Candidatus Pelagibacter sp. RS39]